MSGVIFCSTANVFNCSYNFNIIYISFIIEYIFSLFILFSINCKDILFIVSAYWYNSSLFSIMTFLQHCILYGFAGMLIWLVCYIGTSLQNNLVFQKYEDRFTAHGLAIKAVDALFVLFLIATIFPLWFFRA